MFPRECLGHLCLRTVGVGRIYQYVPSQYRHLDLDRSKNRTVSRNAEQPLFKWLISKVAKLYLVTRMYLVCIIYIYIYIIYIIYIYILEFFILFIHVYN